MRYMGLQHNNKKKKKKKKKNKIKASPAPHLIGWNLTAGSCFAFGSIVPCATCNESFSPFISSPFISSDDDSNGSSNSGHFPATTFALTAVVIFSRCAFTTEDRYPSFKS